jgi:hypothetical protein
MFSREIINEYGDYIVKNKNSVLLKGTYDKNFIELKVIDPTQVQYKVFDSNSINFAIRIGSSTYIPSNIFTKLQAAYNEGNPYFTINDVITIDLDISKTLAFIDGKFNTKMETSQVTYVGSQMKSNSVKPKTVDASITTKSGSVDVNQPAVITSNEPIEQISSFVSASFTKGLASKLDLAGVTKVEYPFYKNNDANIPNDENIIKQIQYFFEDLPTAPKSQYNIIPYQTEMGEVIVANLPASTNVVQPVTMRVTNLDGYLKDVQR